MRLTFVGIDSNGQRYELQGEGVYDINGKFISFYYTNDYFANAAAEGIRRYVTVPDGSPFNHFFEKVEVYAPMWSGDDMLDMISSVSSAGLYRYRCWHED